MRTAFTLIELLVVISIIALLIGILLPALGAARRTARLMQNATQLRGQQQALVIYSQDNGNHYPGLDAKGERWITAADNASDKAGFNVQARFALIVQNDVVSPDYVLSPAETNEEYAHEAWNPGAATSFRSNNYSYAMLELSNSQPIFQTPTVNGYNRTREWNADRLNGKAVVISDRLLSYAPSSLDIENYRNIHSGSGQKFTTSQVWNDNHAETTNSFISETEYDGIRNSSDNIYARSDVTFGNTQTPAAAVVTNGNAMMVAKNYVTVFKSDGVIE